MHPLRILPTVFALTAFLTAHPALAAPPANDNFASAITIGATPYTDSKSTTEATNEPGEPSGPCGGNYSIWYKYTAPSTGTVIADTFGSGFDTELHAFTGSTLATLAILSCNDDYSGLLSRMPFAVEAGQTYYIRVNGYSTNRGSVTFHLSSAVAPTITQCPLIGPDSGCQYLVTAESDATFTQSTDLNQPAYYPYNGRLMGVQNDSGAPLCGISLYASNAFNLTTFGICSANVSPHPGTCPFGPTLYEGPGVTLDGVSNNFGTVTFDPCIADGDSGYFGLAGNSGTMYICADDEVCGPDNDGDGLINDLDNCANQVNPDQANLDGDSQGDVCDGVDNTLTVRGSIKQKADGRYAVVKGLINETEPFFDEPDATDGVDLLVYDQVTYLQASFLPEGCISSTKKIICEQSDGTASLKIALGGAAKGKVSYKLKMHDLETVAPPFFLGPITVEMTEPVKLINRIGSSSTDCVTKPTLIACK